jgi:hypothetical protein
MRKLTNNFRKLQINTIQKIPWTLISLTCNASPLRYKGLVMMFNATFNNISVISWWSVLLVAKENHRPAASHWQTLSHNVVSNTLNHKWDSIDTDCIGSYKSKYHTITTTTAHWEIEMGNQINVGMCHYVSVSLDWFIVFNATFSNIMATSFSGGGSRSIRREPPTMGKQLVNFITCGCESSAPFL